MRGLQDAAVAKLRQHNLAVLHCQWARAITKIGSAHRLIAQAGDEVFGHYRRLLANGRGGFGGAVNGNQGALVIHVDAVFLYVGFQRRHI